MKAGSQVNFQTFLVRQLLIAFSNAQYQSNCILWVDEIAEVWENYDESL